MTLLIGTSHYVDDQTEKKKLREMDGFGGIEEKRTEEK